mgnify:CR=1 FL=1
MNKKLNKTGNPIYTPVEALERIKQIVNDLRPHGYVPCVQDEIITNIINETIKNNKP